MTSARPLPPLILRSGALDGGDGLDAAGVAVVDVQEHRRDLPHLLDGGVRADRLEIKIPRWSNGICQKENWENEGRALGSVCGLEM